MLFYVTADGWRALRIVFYIGYDMRGPIYNTGRSGRIYLACDDTVMRQCEYEWLSFGLICCLGHDLFGQWHVVLIVHTGGNIYTLGGQEGVSHGTTDGYEIGDVDKPVKYIEFIGNFGSTYNCHQWSFRGLHDISDGIDLLFE